MHTDDPAIGDPEVLHRRIAVYGDESMTVVDEHTGQLRATSGAFALDDDGCSVYLHSRLAQAGLDATAIIRAPQNCVVSVTAGSVRSVALGVRADPWPPEGDGHERDAAHGLIVNPNGLGSKRLKKARSALARNAVMTVTPS